MKGKSCFAVVRRFSSWIAGREEGWKGIAKFSLFGSRVMILTGDDELSKEYARRAWFELQKVRKEGVFCTATTVFPNEKKVNEAAELYIRSGCKGLVSIGQSCVTNTAKGVKTLVEGGARSVASLGVGTKSGLAAPLLAITNEYNSQPFLNSWLCLHPEEDILVSRICPHHPEMVVTDFGVLPKEFLPTHKLAPAVVIASLFDVFFVRHLTANGSMLEEFAGKQSREFSEKVNQFRDCESLSPSEVDALLQSCSGMSHHIASCRMKMVEEPTSSARTFGSPHDWPGLVEVMTQIVAVHRLKKTGVSATSTIPQSWQSIEVFVALLEILACNTGANIRDGVTAAAFSAIESLGHLLKMDSNQLLAYCKSTNDVLLVAEHDSVSSDDELTPGGVLQGWVMGEEAVAAVRKKEDRSIFAAETSSENDGTSCKLDALNSDLALDLIEKVLRK